MTRRILIPVDGSEISLKAFDWYLENVRKENDVALFLHVIDPPVLTSLSLTSGMKIPVDEWTKSVQAGIAKAEKLNSQLTVKCMHESKLKNEFYSISHKTPGEGICQFISEKNIDMVIIGNRGLGKLKRALLGSVSDYVLHNAVVPITVVPPTKD